MAAFASVENILVVVISQLSVDLIEQYQMIMIWLVYQIKVFIWQMNTKLSITMNSWFWANCTEETPQLVCDVEIWDVLKKPAEIFAEIYLCVALGQCYIVCFMIVVC